MNASTVEFARRALAAAGVVALVALLIYFVGKLTGVLLLVFAAVLIAAGIDGLTRVVMRFLRLPRVWALLLALGLLIVAAAGAVAFVVPQAAAELPQLVRELPRALAQLRESLTQIPGAEQAAESLSNGQDDSGGSRLSGEVLERLGGVFSSAFGATSSLLLVLVLSIYLAISPATYASHVLRLFPRPRRARIQAVLRTQGRALRLWLLSRLVSMLFIGALTAAGLALLGVPMAFALGLLAGLLTFIPYLGPVLAAIPTVLVALMESPQLALYSVLLYFALETVESNVLAPLVAKGVIELPPAYTVIVQVAGGALAGLPGVVLATPLAVVAVTAVQMLYIEDVLGDDVHVLGEE